MSSVVFAFLAFCALAIIQGLWRGIRNPYAEVPYESLPSAMRSEIERLLPGFIHRKARVRKLGNEARAEGESEGGPIQIEADFDRSGELVELEIDARVGSRMTGIALLADLPEAAKQTVDRVLANARADFQPRRIVKGTLRDGEACYELKGHSGDWKWEIEVSASGRLLELEREKRLQRH